MHFVRVPSLAENVNEATVRDWLVAVGDAVEPGAELAELVTEKAEFTLEAEEDVRGIVLDRLAAEKSTLPVGFILCVVGAEAERDDVQAARDENALLLQKRARQVTVRIRPGEEDAPGAPAPSGAVRATPAARRLAKELGVDLAAVRDALSVTGAVRDEHIRRYADEHGA